MDEPRICIADWHEARDKVMPVRETVFVREQGVPPEIELDEADPTCRHAMAITRDGSVIGTGRLLRDGHVGRMAVLSEFRGKGVGARLLSSLIDEAKRLGMDEVVLNAQLTAEGFYARFGFQPEGEVFMEAGIAHREMRRRL